MNPFSLTKSADMPDSLIDLLWVDLKSAEIDSKIKTLNPVFFIGGKGSGKTHILRYYSYQLQKIRSKKHNIPIIEGIKNDGYVGVYYRCKGLQASRFSGKGYDDELWAAIFEYAFELSLGHELIFILSDLAMEPEYDKKISADIGDLIGLKVSSLKKLEKEISRIRRNLDLAINNCALGSNLKEDENAKILVSRGDFIFKIPKIVKANYPNLDIPFIYFIDEYENFDINHQTYVNTLIREKEAEVSIKIGARLYGVRTYNTLSAGEKLVEGSEKEEFVLDNYYRSQSSYNSFLKALLKNRAEQIENKLGNLITDADVEELFDKYSVKWDDGILKKLVIHSKSHERKYFIAFKKKLPKISPSNIEIIVNNLAVPAYPLLEKVNIYNFYKESNKITDIIEVSKTIQSDCERFISQRDIATITHRALDKYKNNFVSQIRSEYNDSNFYNGIEDIIKMSEGMPRNFLQILKRIYDWSNSMELNPFVDESIESFNLNIQKRAINDSADWFFTDLRECPDKQGLGKCINRLGQLLKINHFSDLPKECSCISIGINFDELNESAKKMIDMAEKYSLLIRNPSNHQDKNNHSNKIRKLHLNRMLCPRWDLPIASRGTKQLNNVEAETIFDVHNVDDKIFNTLRSDWDSSTKFSLSNLQGSLL